MDSIRQQQPKRTRVPQMRTPETKQPLQKNVGHSFAPQSPRHTTKSHHKKPHKDSKAFFIFAIIFFAGSIALLLTFFVYKAVQTTDTITHDFATPTQGLADDDFSDNANGFLSTLTQLARSGDETILAGHSDGRINILLLGIAGTDKPGARLTDTIMVASIDTVKHTVALLSLPRDLLVKRTDGSYSKINRLYPDGVAAGTGAEEMTAKIADITGQPMHYHIVMDFAGFTQIIDALGGINIDIPYAINDTHYPGPGYSYETFQIAAGLQHLNGATALKYARSRHDDPDSDFGRAKRQQQVLRAARNKAFTLGTIANPFKINELLNTVSDHVTMNIAPDEITAFIALINNIDTHNVTTVVVDAWKADSLLTSVRRGNLPGLAPRSGTWDETRELAENIFTRDALRERAAQIATENASVLIIDYAENSIAKRVATHLTGRGFTDVTTIQPPRALPTQEHTSLLDHTDGAYLFSLDEIVKRVSATTITTLPEELNTNTTAAEKKVHRAILDADFVLILGKDLADIYDYEEITQDELEKSITHTETTS